MKFPLVFVVLCFSLLALPGVLAQDEGNVNVEQGYLWLLEHCDIGNCANSVMASSFYALALKNAGYPDHGELGFSYIQSLEHESEHCFPKSSCKVKDTAFAKLVYEQYAEPATDLEEYIRTSLKAGLTENWWLEVITDAADTSCRIQYPQDGELEEVTIVVDQGTFPECKGAHPNTYFDLNACIVPGLVNNNPALELKIDCSAIGPNTIISIIYNEGSSYFVTEQATTAKFTTQLENGCHPEQKNSACNKDSSLWANWILSNQQSDVMTNLWLLNNYDNLKTVDNALLYLSETDANKKTMYLEDLKAIQRLDGSFDKSSFNTAIAVLALDTAGATAELIEAVAWLEKNQEQDGSWEESILTTAVVLYAAFSNVQVNLPPVTLIGGDDPFGECGDGVCDPTETSFSCPQDCENPAPDPGCVENGVCETDFGEDSGNCPIDCFCGDGKCDAQEKNFGSCDQDCGPQGPTQPSEICGNDIREGFEMCDGTDDAACPGSCVACQCQEDEGGAGWLWITIIILLLLVLAIVIYIRYFKHHKKPIKPFSPGGQQLRMPPLRAATNAQQKRTAKTPVRTAQPVRKTASGKSKAEKELEESLAEAKKLLKKG